MMRILIGGIKSGSGKTSVTCAILKVLADDGIPTAPFKCGPDYIDPMFHRFITGRTSHNLDSWMLDPAVLRALFVKNSSGAHVSVIEGVMGLYDGLKGTSAGSTAETAKILKSPVVLVIEGRGISTSIAAMVSGYVNYDREVEIRGVIINGISGEAHYDLLKNIIMRETGVECLGYLPWIAGAEIESRHLGLVPAGEQAGLMEKVERLARAARKTIDMKRLLEIARGAGPLDTDPGLLMPPADCRGLRVGVAMDRAFSFYYGDNLALMREAGMELVEFSPLNDRSLPRDVHGLYLGGGYPEVFARELSDNRPMRDEIRERASRGLPVYAECGGLIYLTESVEERDGTRHPMTGFFGCRTAMTERLKRFGYVEIGYEGLTVRGHEFHYSELRGMDACDAACAFRVSRPGGDASWNCGLSRNRVLAGYPHVHFYSNLKFFEKLAELYRGGTHDN